MTLTEMSTIFPKIIKNVKNVMFLWSESHQNLITYDHVRNVGLRASL